MAVRLTLYARPPVVKHPVMRAQTAKHNCLMLPGMAKTSSRPYTSLLQLGAVSTETVLYLTTYACQALLHPAPCTSPFAVPVRPGHTRRSNSPACPRRRLPCGPAIRAHYTGPSMRSGVPLCPQFFMLASPLCTSGTLQLSWGCTDTGGSDREGLSQVNCGGRLQEG